MGLDQYAYVALKEDQRHLFYENCSYVDGELYNPNITIPKEIAYWRKHPNLQGWMHQRWLTKNPDKENKEFNGVEFELTWEDLDQLEKDILDENVSNLNTTGFFFGNASDSYYREKDLQFIKDAKAEIFLGMRVFYNSSW